MKKSAKYTLTALGAAVTVGALGYGACCLIDEMLFNRNLTPSPKLSQKISGCDNSHLGGFLTNNLAWVENYGYEKHYIISDRGEKLVGYLMKAEKESDVYAFCAHGYRSYGKKEFSGVAQYYLSRGINVFFPDHVASGESEGTHCTFGHYEVADCMKWLDYMTETFGKDITITLHGVSMGCATVTMMSGREDLPQNVKMVVADCGFTKATELFSDKLRALGVPPKHLISVVNVVNKRRLGFDFYSLNPVDSVKNAKIPMLFMHGDADGLVPCYMVKELFNACGSEYKDLLIIEGADHAQCYLKGREEYEEKLGAFIDKFVFVSAAE